MKTVFTRHEDVMLLMNISDGDSGQRGRPKQEK